MDVFRQLKSVSNGVKTLSSRRRDLRFANMTLQDAQTVLQEIELLRTAAVTVTQNVTGTARKHAETAVVWLDVFRQDITLFKEHLSLGLPDQKGQKRAKQYETYKARIIMSIDNAIQNAEQVPLQKSFWHKARNNIAYAAILTTTAFGFSGLNTPRVYAEDPKIQADVKEVNIDDFTDDLAQKLEAKYKTAKEVFDDKDFASDAKVSYIGKGEFAKEIAELKDDKSLVLMCDFNGKDNATILSIRSAILAKYASKVLGVPLKVYDAENTAVKDDLKEVMKQFGSIAEPSLFIVAKYDVVKGETPEKNDGKIKVLDVLAGAPQETKYVKAWARDICKYWASTNLTAPNGSFVWRSQNKRTEKERWSKVEYEKK